MSNCDLNLKLILGVPINVGGIEIHSVKVNQIADFGYLKYNQALKILCMSDYEIKSVLNTSEDVSPFEFLIISVMSDKNIQKLIEETFSLICNEKVIFSRDTLNFKTNKEVINSANFNEITSIICKRNGIMKSDKPSENPSNEKAKRILEKQRIARNKIKRNKSLESGDNLDISDLISILSLTIPISELLNHDIYQLTDKFSRLIKKENYDISVNSLIHGASKNDLNLNHWTEK